MEFTSKASQPCRNAKSTPPVQKFIQSIAVSAVPIKYIAGVLPALYSSPELSSREQNTWAFQISERN